MTTSPDDLSLADRLRLAGFELILQGCPAWLFGAVYEACERLEARDGEPLSGQGIFPEAKLSPTPDASGSVADFRPSEQ